eukprot:3108713-Rhodomonas_salina.1
MQRFAVGVIGKEIQFPRLPTGGGTSFGELSRKLYHFGINFLALGTRRRKFGLGGHMTWHAPTDLKVDSRRLLYWAVRLVLAIVHNQNVIRTVGSQPQRPPLASSRWLLYTKRPVQCRSSAAIEKKPRSSFREAQAGLRPPTPFSLSGEHVGLERVCASRKQWLVADGVGVGPLVLLMMLSRSAGA